MPPENLSPWAWLERQPLQPSEQLFVILGNASDANPLKAYQQSAAIQVPSPIWADTAYAKWDVVMPYVGIVAPDSEFLDWVASTEATDWGWLAVSSASQAVLVEHFHSLTKVLLPNGKQVFFRFWDGRHLLPILQGPEVDASELLPLFTRCLINGQRLEIGTCGVSTAKACPWWEVPLTLLDRLAAKDAITQTNNLLTWLSEARPELYGAYSESVLRHKVAAFVARSELPRTPKEALADYLISEQG